MSGWRNLVLGLGMASVATAFSLSAATRSDVETIAAYQAWSAASFTEGRGRTCYTVSTPVQSVPANVRRGEIFVMVSRRSSENRDELVVMSGYPFKAKTPARVSIGVAKFVLNTGDEFAWVPPGEGIEPLVSAMMGGEQMIVEGVSARGTETTDTYSLLGFTAAYKAIVTACR